MSFQDDMTRMSPEQVRQAVRGRLVEGRGLPWSEARGEPQWGLLRSSFLVWRQEPAQLAAFQAALSEVLTEAATAGCWGVVSEAAELCVALHAAEPKPHWPADQWPILQWLSRATESDERLRASVALLQLGQLNQGIELAWFRDAFNLSVARLFDGNKRASHQRELQWLLSVWRARLNEMGSDDVNPLPWFDLFRAIASVTDTKQRERLYDLALASARPIMTSAEMQSAIQSLEQTKLHADKHLVLELMSENWCSKLAGCDTALQVARKRLEKAASSPSNRNLSLRSPQTAGATRRSEACPAA